MEFLREKPRSTREIIDYINKNTKYGTCMQTLGNLLGKDPAFEKDGQLYELSESNRIKATTLWKLKGERY